MARREISAGRAGDSGRLIPGAMAKTVALCLLLAALAALASCGHHHDTTGSTHSSDSTDTSSSSDTTSSSDSSDSHHHSDHHPHGSSYSSHDHDDHHRHGGGGGAHTNQVRAAQWTSSDEGALLRQMRVALDAAKLRGAEDSAVPPAALLD